MHKVHAWVKRGSQKGMAFYFWMYFGLNWYENKSKQKYLYFRTWFITPGSKCASLPSFLPCLATFLVQFLLSFFVSFLSFFRHSTFISYFGSFDCVFHLFLPSFVLSFPLLSSFSFISFYYSFFHSFLSSSHSLHPSFLSFALCVPSYFLPSFLPCLWLCGFMFCRNLSRSIMCRDISSPSEVCQWTSEWLRVHWILILKTEPVLVRWDQNPVLCGGAKTYCWGTIQQGIKLLFLSYIWSSGHSVPLLCCNENDNKYVEINHQLDFSSSQVVYQQIKMLSTMIH